MNFGKEDLCSIYMDRNEKNTSVSGIIVCCLPLERCLPVCVCATLVVSVCFHRFAPTFLRCGERNFPRNEKCFRCSGLRQSNAPLAPCHNLAPNLLELVARCSKAGECQKPASAKSCNMTEDLRSKTTNRILVFLAQHLAFEFLIVSQCFKV